jgi:site-specific recombinase XerD
MQDHIDQFLVFMQHNKGRSDRTSEVYRLALSRLMDFLAESDRDWRRVTHDDLLMFTGIWLHRKGLKDPISRRAGGVCGAGVLPMGGGVWSGGE